MSKFDVTVRNNSYRVTANKAVVPFVMPPRTSSMESFVILPRRPKTRATSRSKLRNT